MNKLSELTLEDLTGSLRAAADLGTEADAGAWNALIQIADDLGSNDRVDRLTKNRKWLLRQVSVSGFRGAKQEVTLTIDNPKGITVLFGENGSGKSTLAEAVRVALVGRTGATHLGGNGTVHELWSASDQRSQGAVEAAVTVVLVDKPTNDCLTINATITRSGVKRVGVLESRGEQTELDDESPEWKLWADAVRASPPVLAYAELADELQKKKDLQIWLTSCLAMDSASRLFDSQVKELVSASSDAEKLLSSAKEESVRLVNAADEEARRQGVEGVDPLEWVEPRSYEELDRWLKTNNLAERRKLDNHLDVELLTTLPAYSADFLKRKDKWAQDATQALLTPEVTDSILDMNSRVIDSDQGDNNGVCPACGATHTDWRNHLREEAARFSEARASAIALKKLIRRSQEDLISPLKTCLAVLHADFNDREKLWLRSLVDEAESARQSVDDLNSDLLNAIHNLAKWSTRPEATLLLKAALSASGFEHQWLCRRWDAVCPYISAFESNIELAVKHPTLKKARAKWNSHLARIRGERSSDLHALVGPAVATLLEDAGISVESIDITKSESRLDLQNARGESVELAHLSAGQRNALILGPVIATAESGIFAFTILDDPVHAFDDFRVDRLSATLAKLARNQSLLLTTHDARFIEYLRVHAALEFEVFGTSRDDDGQITLKPTLDPPAELIKFGRQLTKDLDKAQASEGRAEITSLLRMALDEAFEIVSLRHFSRLPAAEAEVDRQAFARAMFTKRRKQMLSNFLADSPQQQSLLADAWQRVSASSKRWSEAVHDPSKVPDPEQLVIDFDTAEESIEMLREIRW